MTEAGSPCSPGDVLWALGASERVVIGAGVIHEDSSLIATRKGIVRWDEARALLWVENDARRYWPALGDHVIGVVADKGAADYKLDLGGAVRAMLPVLAFDGATKRNRPQLSVRMLHTCSASLPTQSLRQQQQHSPAGRWGHWSTPGS